MKKLIMIALLMASGSALADMPYINNNTAENRERVQKGEFVCETSKAQTTINAGVYGSSEGLNSGNSYYGNYQNQNNDKGGYIGISIPIGEGPKVDCSQLYDQVIRENDLRIKQLEMQVKLLEQRNLTIGK